MPKDDTHTLCSASAPASVKSQRLQISMITETYPPEINGVAMTCERMLRGLRQDGHGVQLVRPRQAADRASASADESVTIVPSLRIPLYPQLQMGMPVQRRLLRAWRQQRPDLVHIDTEGPLGFAALSAARQLAIPVVASFHTNFHRYSQHYHLGWLQPLVFGYLRYFHNRCSTTLVPTQALAAELRNGGISTTDVLARGVDTQLFRPEHRDETLRRQWGIDHDHHVVLYVGRLAAEKNLALAVTAFDAMRSVNPHLRFVLVGDGPQAQRLSRQRPDLVFAGTRTGVDLARHYASADVFLFPSLTETFGNVVLEAMASGLAVVAFDQAAAQQYIKPSESGLLAAAESPDQFINHAVILASQPSLTRELGEKAHQAMQSLSWDRIHEGLLVIYRRVIEEARCHGGIAKSVSAFERV